DPLPHLRHQLPLLFARRHLCGVDCGSLAPRNLGETRFSTDHARPPLGRLRPRRLRAADHPLDGTYRRPADLPATRTVRARVRGHRGAKTADTALVAGCAAMR